MRKRQGFGLVELIVLLAVLLVIAAITLPGLLRTKIATNEQTAIDSLRTLVSACGDYKMSYGGYPKGLSNLGPGAPASAAAAALVDSNLANGGKSGYIFLYAAGATDAGGNVLSYSITASPVKPGTTGRRQFYSDQSGVIRASGTGAANADSTPIG